jgi:hypothetical protein
MTKPSNKKAITKQKTPDKQQCAVALQQMAGFHGKQQSCIHRNS